jgi:hypothetical protein
LRLIKVWFSASTLVVKIATFAKRQTVIGQCKKTANPQMAHLVLPDTQANPSQNQKSHFLPTHRRTTKRKLIAFYLAK